MKQSSSGKEEFEGGIVDLGEGYIAVSVKVVIESCGLGISKLHDIMTSVTGVDGSLQRMESSRHGKQVSSQIQALLEQIVGRKKELVSGHLYLATWGESIGFAPIQTTRFRLQEDSEEGSYTCTDDVVSVTGAEFCPDTSDNVYLIFRDNSAPQGSQQKRPVQQQPTARQVAVA